MIRTMSLIDFKFNLVNYIQNQVLSKKNFRTSLAFLISFLLTSICYSEEKCAILLHGLGRTASSLSKIESELIQKKFQVWNETYPSTEKSIQELSLHIKDGLDFCARKNLNSIYFVTHSMGGILVRKYYQNKIDPKVKAVVMLAPPNRGSEIAEEFKNASWFKWYSGLAGQELGTNSKSTPNTLKPISLPIGIIAGTESSDPWFSYLFKGPNDGKVSVESAKLDEMLDFITLPVGHTFIMNDTIVHRQIIYFFENKKFQK